MNKSDNKMGKVIQLPTTRKGNAEIHVEAEFKYADDLERNMLDVRLQRIKESLNRINELMRNLKETTDAKVKE